MFCIHCGKKLPDDARVCDACGTPVRPEYGSAEGDARSEGYRDGYDYGRSEGSGSAYDYGRPEGSGSDYDYGRSGGYSGGPERGGGTAIAALVLGILSAVSCCIPYFSIPLSLAGIVCGALGLKSSRRSMAVAALILSIVFLVLGVAYLIFLVTALVPYMDEFWEIFEYYSRQLH